MATHPSHALRLTFAYDGAQIRLIRTERVAMIVPASVGDSPAAGQTGYWFGILDAAGRTVYHRALANPLRFDVEAFSPDERQSIARVPAASRQGQFTVLVPDVADAHAFELHGPADPARADEPARPLLRLDVDALRKWQPPRAGRTTPP